MKNPLPKYPSKTPQKAMICVATPLFIVLVLASFDLIPWTAALIAVCIAVGIALIMLAMVMIMLYKSFKDEENGHW